MEENNKRIIKNSLYLYVRMFLMMALSFITTRVVLDKLGASDYGINTLVAGFVALFSVLNNVLSSGTQRFLALHIGKGLPEKLKATFSTAFVLHAAAAALIVIALESFGLWFFNHDLNIPAERMSAANWVFQFAVIGVFVAITQTPYSAAVTAHERFNVYAFMSIYDIVAKLAVLYLLVYIPGDKLIIYAALQLSVSVTSMMIYRVYCIRSFAECRFSLHVDKSLAKDMLHFSGWGVLGHVINMVNSQGLTIILNLFFNTVMNAARGLATTVNFVIVQFIAGFLVAAQPQLIKYYGAGDIRNFTKLIFNVTQYTLFLVALVAVPAILEIDYVIALWLGANVPEYTGAFVKITLFCGIIGRSNTMVEWGIMAIGRVKELNACSVPVYLLSLPLVYFVLRQGWGPETAYWVGSIPPLLSFLINVYLLSKFIDFPGKKFMLQIFLKNLALIIISAIIPYVVQQQMEPGLMRFLVVCTLSVASTFGVIWFLGLTAETREMFKRQVIGRFIKKFKNC